MNNELAKVSDWIASNNLTLNVSKTCYMVSSISNINEDHVHIKIGNNLLTRVKHIKFLGINIDDRLTWKPHLNQLCNKISQMTGIFYKIRNNLTVDCLKLLYMSIVYPHLLYCSAIWGGAFSTLIDGIFVAQEKIVRVMFSCKRYDHTNPLFSQYSLLKVPDIIALQTCIFVFQSIHVYPNDTNFESLSHNVNTTRPNDLRLPLCRTVQAQPSVNVRGVREWNNLPHDAKNITSINLFRNKMKYSLFQS